MSDRTNINKKALDKIKKLKDAVVKTIKFFTTEIGMIVFLIIIILIVLLLVYIFLRVLYEEVADFFGLDDPGFANSADYDFLMQLSSTEYEDMLPAEELIEYYNFEYACLMDAARFIEETGVAKIGKQSIDDGFDVSKVSILADALMNSSVQIDTGSASFANNVEMTTTEDYARWIWALLNAKADNAQWVTIRDSIVENYATAKASQSNSTGGGGSSSAGTGTGSSAGSGNQNQTVKEFSNEDSKEELYYQKVKNEYTGETSLVPYLLIHRDWDRLKYRFYDTNEQNNKSADASLASANGDASYIYNYIYGLHANTELNANNVAILPGEGHAKDSQGPLSLDKEYPATLYYDTAGVAPATYTIPLKVLIDRYLPKAVLMTTWSLAKDDPDADEVVDVIDELLRDIKNIYNGACLEGEEPSGEIYLVKNIWYNDNLEDSDLSNISSEGWKETGVLDKYIDGEATDIIIDGYAPLGDVRTLVGSSTAGSQGASTSTPVAPGDGKYDHTLLKIMKEKHLKQEFKASGEDFLYKDVIDDVKLALTQHNLKNIDFEVRKNYSLIEEDLIREVEKFIKEKGSTLLNSDRYTEELVIYRGEWKDNYIIECEQMVDEQTHHSGDWRTVQNVFSEDIHQNQSLNEYHDMFSKECKAVMQEDHGDPYDINNPYIDCFVPYLKISIKSEDVNGVRLRSTLVRVYEPVDNKWEDIYLRRTDMDVYGYMIVQKEVSDLTNEQSFVTFARGVAEQSNPLYTNWYSLGDSQELYVVTDLVEAQAFSIPSKLTFTVTGIPRYRNDDMTIPLADRIKDRDSITPEYVTIDVSNNYETLLDIFIRSSNYAASGELISPETLVIKRSANASGEYDLTPPGNAAPTTASHLKNGAGESVPLGSDFGYVKYNKDIGDIQFDSSKLRQLLEQEYKDEVYAQAISQVNHKLGLSSESESYITGLYNSNSDIYVTMPALHEKLAMFLVEKRMCTIGTDVDYITMPMYFVKSAKTWSGVKYFSTTFQLQGKPIEKGNYLYLIQAQRFNNGLRDVISSMSAHWRGDMYAPIFQTVREKDVILMMSQLEDIGAQSKENNYVYTYMRDIYRLINYTKGIKDANGDWLMEPIGDDENVYVNNNSFTNLYIADEVLYFDETITEKAYWLDRLMATFGTDEVTYQENLEMRNSMPLMTWQEIDYNEYPECKSGDRYLVYTKWPIGGSLGRSLITFDSATNESFRKLLDYGSYVGVGTHGGSDWHGRSNANKIYESVYGVKYDDKKPLPIDTQPAITSKYNIDGTVELIIDDSKELGYDDMKGKVHTYSGPITINLGGKDYTFKTSASAVYGYELYRLTLINKSAKKAQRILREQLEEEIVWTPVVASAPGYVTDVAASATGGFAVSIVHSKGAENPNGEVNTYGSTTSYLHMKRYPIVQVGQYVGAGTILGYEGTTGNSGGYHVHFEVGKDGQKNRYGIPFMFPMFAPFYYEEKTVNESGEILPLSSEYFGLERTIYPVQLKAEEIEGPLVNTGLSNAKGIDYVNAIEVDEGKVKIKNYVPTDYLTYFDLLYNNTDNIPERIALDKERLILPILNEDDILLGGSSYTGENVKTLEVYFNEEFIDLVLEEENIEAKLLEYESQASSIQTTYDSDGDVAD